jgi:hypothetical protein
VENISLPTSICHATLKKKKQRRTRTQLILTAKTHPCIEPTTPVDQEKLWDMDTFLGLWFFFNDQVKE